MYRSNEYYPQLVLGFCIAWGIVMGGLALDATPLRLKFDDTNTTSIYEVFESGTDDKLSHRMSVIALVIGATIWTIIYDTVYAHQDLEDDKREGIKSIAVLYGIAGTKALLWRLLVVLVLSFVACGWLSGFGVPFYSIAVGGSIGALGSLVAFVDLEDGECLVVVWEWVLAGGGSCGCWSVCGVCCECPVVFFFSFLLFTCQGEGLI